jgi:hypothetical protein
VRNELVVERFMLTSQHNWNSRSFNEIMWGSYQLEELSVFVYDVCVDNQSQRRMKLCSSPLGALAVGL